MSCRTTAPMRVLPLLLFSLCLSVLSRAQDPASSALFDEILPLEAFEQERDLFGASFTTERFRFQNGKTLDFYFADDRETLTGLAEVFPTPSVVLGRDRFNKILRLLDNYEARISEFENLDTQQTTQIEKLSAIQREMERTDSLRQLQLRNYEESLNVMRGELDQMGDLVTESNEIARKLDRRRIWNYIIGGLAGITVGILVLD